MPARTFTVDIVTPDRVVLSDRSESLVAPGVLGSFGILPNHAPLLSELAVGELRYRRENGEEVRLVVGGGFIQVFDNQVTVLADSAERVEEIDLDRARRALESAQEAVRAAQSTFDEAQRMNAQRALERAQNRLRAARDQ